MDSVQKLKKDYPWIQTPLIVGAPMRLISLAELAVKVSAAGGIGFIAAGTDVSDLEMHLQETQSLLSQTTSPALPTNSSTLPIGVGFITWGASLHGSMRLISTYRPAAVWFFAPRSVEDLRQWTEETRKASPETKVWVQVGSVKEAIETLSVQPDVLVFQGADAGGHGLVKGAGIVSLVPEAIDAVESYIEKNGGRAPAFMAAGGIADARGAAAAFALGAAGVVIGTRFLAAREAYIPKGYQDAVLAAEDGGQSTVRTKLYDTLRGTIGWPETYNGRGVINKSFEDAEAGMDEEENMKLYTHELRKGDAGWGVNGRRTTYAGTGVGLVKEVKGAAEIVTEVREGIGRILGGLSMAAGVEKS